MRSQKHTLNANPVTFVISAHVYGCLACAHMCAAWRCSLGLGFAGAHVLNRRCQAIKMSEIFQTPSGTECVCASVCLCVCVCVGVCVCAELCSSDLPRRSLKTHWVWPDRGLNGSQGGPQLIRGYYPRNLQTDFEGGKRGRKRIF